MHTFKIHLKSRNQHSIVIYADTSISPLKKKKEEKKNRLNRTYLLKARSNRIDVGYMTEKEHRKTFYLAFHRVP